MNIEYWKSLACTSYLSFTVIVYEYRLVQQSE